MNKKKKLKISYTAQIFIAMALALIVGYLLRNCPEIALTYIKPYGTIFLNLIKCFVCLLVFFSIISGAVSFGEMKKVWKIGGITLLYYLATTVLAVTIGLATAFFMENLFPKVPTDNLFWESAEAEISFTDRLIGIFPSNIFRAFYEADMLQIIVASLIIAFSLIMISNAKDMELSAIHAAKDICLKAMDTLLILSPIGVFCMLCPILAEEGPAVLGKLSMVLLATYLAYIIHAAFIYSLSVKFLGHMKPLDFFKGMMPAITFAFSSASSVGTIPLNMENTWKLGADEEISSIVLPLGAAINMDGTAIYQGVCMVFIAYCYDIRLTVAQILTIVLTTVISSIGTAGIPGAGMVMLAMVLESVGLPIEGIALVASVDRLFDMGRTVINITGDASCAIVVSEWARKHRAKKEVKSLKKGI